MPLGKRYRWCSEGCGKTVSWYPKTVMCARQDKRLECSECGMKWEELEEYVEQV